MGRGATILPLAFVVACGAVEAVDAAPPLADTHEPPNAGPHDDASPRVVPSNVILRRGEQARIRVMVLGFTGLVRVRLELPPAVGAVVQPPPTSVEGEILIDVAKEAPLGEVGAALVADDESGHHVGQRTGFIVRMPIGSLDTTFGDGGRVVVPGVPLFAMHRHYGTGSTFLVVAGTRSGELVAAAIEGDGSLDPTFGGTGTGMASVAHTAGDGPVALTSTVRGPIVLAGGQSALALARLSVSGFPLGVTTTPLRDTMSVASVIMVGNRAIACGTATEAASGDAAFACAAYVDGALDPSFGTGGTWVGDQSATPQGAERVVFSSVLDGFTVGGEVTSDSGARELVVATRGADGKNATTTRTAAPDGALGLIGLSAGGETGGMRSRACTFPVWRTASSFVLANGVCTIAAGNRVAPAPVGLGSLALVATSGQRTVAGSVTGGDGRTRGILGRMGGDDENAPDASATIWMTSPPAAVDESFAGAFEDSEWVYGIGSSNDDGLVMRFWR